LTETFDSLDKGWWHRLPPFSRLIIGEIHHRLALILHPRGYNRWLGIADKGGDPRPPLDLLHPYDADKMVMKPANPAFGTGAITGRKCLVAPKPGRLLNAINSANPVQRYAGHQVQPNECCHLRPSPRGMQSLIHAGGVRLG
jgi:hypothetical protein